MKNKLSPLQIFQVLSLDVVAGALFSGMAVARVLDCTMPQVWFLALPLAVWVVYTADHLLDARRLGEKAHTLRHRFHHEYFWPITIIWLIALLSCMSWIMWLAGPGLRLLGLGMGGLVLIHLGLVAWVGSRRSWLIVKELGVATIYSAGVWGGPWIMCDSAKALSFYSLAGQFFLLALINLIIFSLYEARTDLLDGHSSWVLGIGLKRTRIIIAFLLVAALGLGIGSLLASDGAFQLLAVVQLLMLALLTILLLFPAFFTKNGRYRLLGDGVFLLPVLVAIF